MTYDPGAIAPPATKIWLKCAALACLLSTFNILLSTAFAQGSLTPPGAPGATMLTLSQVEPRTPISSVPFTITQRGSYYLTTNLVCSVSNAVTIAVNGVSLDLCGFTISSTVGNAANGGAAILLNTGLGDITICNGHIRGGVTNNGSGVYSGTGFGYGIYSPGISPVNVLVSRVSVSGCLIDGIYLNNGDSTVVESCTVRTMGTYGIVSSLVKQSSAVDCGLAAIYADQVSDSRGESNGSGSYGIEANDCAQNCYGSGSFSGIDADTIQNCFGSGGSYGIEGYTALNCLGESPGSGDGIDAFFTAIGCIGSSNSGLGISAYIANSCYSNSGDSGISYKYNMP